MAYITRIQIHCYRQEDWTGSDDLDFYVDSTWVGRVTIGNGESRDVTGSTALANNGWVDAGQTIYVYEDDFDPDDLVLSHTVTDHDIDNGLSTKNTSGNCDYSFDFTFTRI